METITELSITTIEKIVPDTMAGYLTAIETFNGMLEDNLTEKEIEMIQAAKDRAFKKGQQLRLEDNQKNFAGDLCQK